jgi:hypothetical protein
METHPTHDQAGRRWIAIALIIAGLLAGALFATVVTSPAQIQETTSAPSTMPALNFVPSDWGDVGTFAFGHVEFDWDPKAPGGVPGFDSWPPGSPPRR